MAQGLDGVFDHSLVDDARPDSDRRSLRWLLLPIFLASGWGVFFGFTVFYLSEGTSQRPLYDSERGETHPAHNTFVMVPEAPSIPTGRTPWREPDTAILAPEPATTDGVPAGQAANPVGADASAPVAAAVSRVPDLERVDFVGVWGPTQAACQAPSRRHGFIQAKITLGGAKAGRTICSFRDSRRTGNAWIMAADCSDRGRRWSSQVRLTVEGDRLTWSSAKGASAYVRCGRREG